MTTRAALVALPLLLLLAAPASASGDTDAIWRWIWRERAELRAEREERATRTEQTTRTERRELSPVEKRRAERKAASAWVARRAVEWQAGCGPLPARVVIGSSTERARVLRDGNRIWIDTDRDGRYDDGEPVLVVEK